MLKEGVNAALNTMNLPQPDCSDGDSDYNSDFDDPTT